MGGEKEKGREGRMEGGKGREGRKREGREEIGSKGRVGMEKGGGEGNSGRAKNSAIQANLKAQVSRLATSRNLVACCA